MIAISFLLGSLFRFVFFAEVLLADKTVNINTNKLNTKIEEVSLNVKERIGGKTESRLTKESRPRQTSVRHLPTISPKTIGPQTLPRPKNKKRGF